MNLRRASAASLTAVALLFSGTVLSACSDDPGDTTCGDYKDKSADDQVDLLDDAAEDEGGDSKEQWDALSDDDKKLVAEGLAAACDGADDDTKLEDLE